MTAISFLRFKVHGRHSASANAIFAALTLKRAYRVCGARGGFQRGDRLRRDLARYLTHVEAQRPIKHVQRVCGLSRKDLKQRIKDVEEQREDPSFDDWMALLAEKMRLQ